jgi:type II secretory pathway component PulJ
VIRQKCSAGVTLLEVLIGLFISVIICSAVYYAISHARFVASVTTARGEAKQEAQLAMRYLNRDISNSRAIIDYSSKEEETVSKTLDFSGGKLTLEVPKGFSEDDKITLFDSNATQDDSSYEKVEYNLAGTVLTRNGQNAKTLSKHVKEFDISENYDGKVQVNLKIEKPITGSAKTVEHSESAVILVREAEKVKGDKNWRQRLKKGEY